jgi:hypothetical protein
VRYIISCAELVAVGKVRAPGSRAHDFVAKILVLIDGSKEIEKYR